MIRERTIGEQVRGILTKPVCEIVSMWKKRTITLLILVLVSVYLWSLFDEPSARFLRARARLWSHGGRALNSIAFEAEHPANSEDEFEALPRFPKWANWPTRPREEVIAEGLRPVGTESVDGLVVTTFIKSGDLAARWFYVVPAKLGTEKPWFCVIAMDSEWCFHTRYPIIFDPVTEKHKDKPVDPMEVVKRICTKQE